MHEFHWWNWINVFFMFANLYIAVECFKEDRNFGGHLNMFAVVINSLAVGITLT